MAILRCWSEKARKAPERKEFANPAARHVPGRAGLPAARCWPVRWLLIDHPLE